MGSAHELKKLKHRRTPARQAARAEKRAARAAGERPDAREPVQFGRRNRTTRIPFLRTEYR